MQNLPSNTLSELCNNLLSAISETKHAVIKTAKMGVALFCGYYVAFYNTTALFMAPVFTDPNTEARNQYLKAIEDNYTEIGNRIIKVWNAP
ncbi:hypothetical protein [Parendozoicomonas sp. Alg238-R29]|uniref:hypothetical protein n=1 Tax=Parendozoicomonas sp. Alg238-R29 TaxID=2993446 RepID=UPI00248EB042|nr:hypothetical protein [Parendozoicomonas sp. Alg238-R29]